MQSPSSVLCVVGTRPEALKTSPVVRELRRRGVPAYICLTGQHPTLGSEALEVCGMAADVSCTLDGPATPQAIRSVVEPVVRKLRPAVVVVHGDTSSTLGGALAARAAGARIAHLEAGLRSHDLLAPFPEELYRRIVDRMSDLHLAPTPTAHDNLLAEGFDRSGILVSGNTGIDALHRVLAAQTAVPQRRRMLLVTAHRRENLGAPLHRIVAAIGRLVARYPDLEVVVPVHPNPTVGEAFAQLQHPNVQRVQPLAYPRFVDLMQRAHAILTDSGGVQEEAPVLGTPVLVLRDNTERPEGVAAGTARLVGTDTERIVSETARLLDDEVHHARMSRVHSPYGDGQAAGRIAAFLAQALAPQPLEREPAATR